MRTDNCVQRLIKKGAPLTVIPSTTFYLLKLLFGSFADASDMPEGSKWNGTEGIIRTYNSIEISFIAFSIFQVIAVKLLVKLLPGATMQLQNNKTENVISIRVDEKSNQSSR